jgi:hypothetical protein
MPQGATLQVKGYQAFMRALVLADKADRKAVRTEFRKFGDIVRRDAVQRFSPVNARSAGGYRTRVRQRGVAVEQSIRKTTGVHPEYGSLQMRRALVPALWANEDDLIRDLEQALDRVADHFNHSGGV